MIDSARSATATKAKTTIRFKPERGFEAATVLRGLLHKVALNESHVAEETGVALGEWRELLDQMLQARYGVLLSATRKADSTAESLAIARLVRELNDHTRWVHLNLSGSVNSAGAANVLAWRTGFSHGVDFASSDLATLGRDLFYAERLLERGEVDAALVVCDDPDKSLSSLAQENLARIPRVVIDWRQTPAWRDADVSLSVAMPGTEAMGTMFRLDGVPLELRRVIDSVHLPDFEVLRLLETAIRSAGDAVVPGTRRC